jgi:hypothetical protein
MFLKSWEKIRRILNLKEPSLFEDLIISRRFRKNMEWINSKKLCGQVMDECVGATGPK